MPEELKTQLEKNKKVKNSFDRFPPSMKKMHYRLILRAKRPETRQKRITEIIKMCKDKSKK
jgi:uncharacterized protein YdeI (YjbR/CyaY-like superfamily)